MSHCSSCGAPSDAQERIRELEGACAEMRAQIRNALLCSHHGDAYQYMQKALSSSAGTGWLSPQDADALRQEVNSWERTYRADMDKYGGEIIRLSQVVNDMQQEADALRQERDRLRKIFNESTSDSPMWEGAYADILNLQEEADRLRDALESVMEWAEHFATPMADELKETVRELLKEKADD